MGKIIPSIYIQIGLYTEIYGIYIVLNVMKLNIFPSAVQKHASYVGSLKRFLIYYELCLEMAENVLSIVFQGF